MSMDRVEASAVLFVWAVRAGRDLARRSESYCLFPGSPAGKGGREGDNASPTWPFTLSSCGTHTVSRVLTLVPASSSCLLPELPTGLLWPRSLGFIFTHFSFQKKFRCYPDLGVDTFFEF